MPTIECSAILFDLDGTVSTFSAFADGSLLIQPLPSKVCSLRECQAYDSAHWTDFANDSNIDPAIILATSHGYFVHDGKLANRSRRTYEVLQEHCPKKANWEYIKSWEADIPRKHGDKASL